MPQVVQCIEPDSLPIQISLEIPDGELFCVYLLSDASTAPGGLRSTILVRANVDPPPEASLVFEVAIYDPGTGDPAVMRVRRLGSTLNTDLVRPHVRSRVTPGTEIRSGSRLEVILPDLRRVSFTLQLEAEVHQSTSSAIGGGAIRHKQAVAGGDSAYFLYSTVRSIMSLNIQYLIARGSAFFTKLGIPPWIIPLAITALLVVGGTAYFAYRQYKAAGAAEEQAAKAEEELAKAQAAQDMALANEMECMAQRQALAMKLQEKVEEVRALVEETLQRTFTIGVALGEGGARMGEDKVVERDGELFASTRDRVVTMVQELIGVPSEASVCLEHESILVPDLPRYVLLWHPDPELVCPPDYASEENGVNRAGRWGLSERIKRQYGGEAFQQELQAAMGDAAADDPASADPRMADRWSVAVMARGLRDVQVAMLTSDAGNRVPVAPSQTHLWSLALWDAYNRMPSPADGVLDSSPSICVTELMEQVTRTAAPAEPGAPLLPNIVDVASGEQKLRPTPTSGCPWPEDAIQQGAAAALRAVAHTANYTQNGS